MSLPAPAFQAREKQIPSTIIPCPNWNTGSGHRLRRGQQREKKRRASHWAAGVRRESAGARTAARGRGERPQVTGTFPAGNGRGGGAGGKPSRRQAGPGAEENQSQQGANLRRGIRNPKRGVGSCRDQARPALQAWSGTVGRQLGN
ncbi:uncharacterized protein LOC122744153 isoform X2 [Dromiciops gliroides]|uniref:uncharacterized protein LOC122744153 isoform X2 n=1 Tax=Dromiciops gliroides TaxID=33562 RepID=UPI001CC36A35|nr:uncharacterized protein LOC122744153 isoform X2 [Dromiciops gliroides]